MSVEREVYEFGSFRLLAGEGVLLRDGRPVALSPKALDTLRILVQRAGHVVSKTEIMETVWPDTVVEEANLTQNISTLRKVLDDGIEGSHIETFPKRGYRFATPVRRPHATDAEQPAGRPRGGLSPDLSGARPSAAAEEVARTTPVPPRSLRLRRAGLLGGGALVVIALAVALWPRSPAPAPPTGRVMLAVLPFENLTGDPEHEYVSDGLTEETIAQVGALAPERLGVIARTSVMAYKGDPRSVTEISRELGVRYLLEGSVRRDGERVRVTVQLIETSDQALLWSDSFENDWTGLLQVQKEVAGGIARTLGTELLGGTETPLARQGTDSVAAYEAYLRGRFFWNQRTLEGFESSLVQYEEALRLDPDYAQAWAGLADTYMLLRNYAFAPTEEMLPKSEAAARRAIELDPTLAPPHATLAGVYAADREWERALEVLRHAIELDPNYVTARQWYAVHLALHGRFDEAINEMQRARELDPLSPRVNADLARVLYFARRYDEAIAQCRATLELAPDFGPARFQLGLAYLETGDQERAIAELERAAGSQMSMWLGYAYARVGRRADAVAMLARLRQRWEQARVQAEGIALVYTGLGDLDAAFEWLARALEDRSGGIDSLKAYPYWDPLRGDPRFDDLLRRLRLSR